MTNQLLHDVSEGDKRIILKLQDTEIHSLKELREHFNHDEILASFACGDLFFWLQQHYYETETNALRSIHPSDTNCFRRICDTFQVNYLDHVTLSEEEKKRQKQKESLVRQVITDTKADEKLLKELPYIAVDQEELAGLINAGETKIYLCNESFSIPISKPGIEYIGIGDVQIENSFTQEQYSKAGITITNITLPVTENPETIDSARMAAFANGYDSFSETHSALATMFHDKLKTHRMYKQYHLPFQSSVMGTFYNSRSECVSAKRSALEKAYQKAGRYLTPDNSDCIAKAAAKYYHEHIHTIFTTPILEELEKLCELKNKSFIYHRLKEMLRQDQKKLLSLLETELRENADYYSMYEFDYFMDQVEIEEHDYRISEGGFLRALESLAGGSIQYTITDIHSAISEMENDLNDYANTFCNTAQSEYQEYCRELEDLIQEIGNDFSGVNDHESLSDYLNRLYTETIQKNIP